MSNDTTATKEQLAADFRNVMSDIDALMAPGGAKTESESAALRARVHERLEAARRRLVDFQHDAAAQARRAAHATDDFVHDRPWQAVGMAAAVGVLLGMLIARR
jgi:ElaB/YqjD/DUF883 family membrane-anchored ribosome-binding protein